MMYYAATASMEFSSAKTTAPLSEVQPVPVGWHPPLRNSLGIPLPGPITDASLARDTTAGVYRSRQRR